MAAGFRRRRRSGAFRGGTCAAASGRPGRSGRRETRDADCGVDAAHLAAGATDVARHGGAFVSLLNSAPMMRRQVLMTDPAWHGDAERPAELAAYAGEGLISLRVARTYPLEQVADAHHALAAGGLRGRIVWVPDQY
ncbi:zinc-binding dehydrogenase [Streptomyces sp. NPDC020898]|uniref:zinc-binding dehydrogenase n=1 Tax=Streptomyces sp. NPDC020898 TaxID=3365101 RepID=UPI0037B11201